MSFLNFVSKDENLLILCTSCRFISHYLEGNKEDNCGNDNNDLLNSDYPQISQVVLQLFLGSCPPYCAPIEEVKKTKENRKENEEAEVGSCIVVFLSLGSTELS